MSNQQIAKWQVHKFFIDEISPPKPKFVVVLQSRATSFLGAFINSDIPEWLQKPAFEHCHCVLPQSTHSFLDYDSKFHVDDRNIREYELDRVSESTVVGEIHMDSRDTIKALLTRCRLLKPIFARELLSD